VSGRWLQTAQAWVSRLAGSCRLTGTGMSLGGCKRPGKTVGAHEQTVRGWKGGESHKVDKIGCGKRRREPHERAREGACPLDMGEEGLGSEGGGGRGERIGRDEGGRSNEGKTSTEYGRALRESGSVGEAEVGLVEFWMRN